MNDEVRESKSIKMKPSIVRKAHLKAFLNWNSGHRRRFRPPLRTSIL